MATTTVAFESIAGLDEIHVSGNVRALDIERVRALAGSISLQGMLVPVIVRPAEGDVAPGGGSTSSSPASIGWPQRSR